MSNLQSLLAIVKTLQLQAEGGQVKGQSRKETKNFIHGLKQLESGLKMMRDNSGTAEKDEVPTDQLRAISIVASSSLALHNPSQLVALPVPAMRTLAQRRADFQQEQQERRPLVQMWSDALLDVAWNRAQQSAHYLTPAARPWEIITGPDGRLFKQVIVDVIEDFGQICDRVLVLANNYQVPLETFNGMHPERLANVILSRRDEFQRAYQGLREEIKVDFITGATTLKIQFAWPDASLGIY